MTILVFCKGGLCGHELPQSARIDDCLPAIAFAVTRYAKFKSLYSGEAGGSIDDCRHAAQAPALRVERQSESRQAGHQSTINNHKSSIQRGQQYGFVILQNQTFDTRQDAG
jgi:hypothetical protein